MFCKLYDWLTANKLSNYVIFRPRQKKVKYEVNLRIFNHNTNSYVSLESKKKTYVKHLGVLIDENLSSVETSYHSYRLKNKYINWYHF